MACVKKGLSRQDAHEEIRTLHYKWDIKIMR